MDVGNHDQTTILKMVQLELSVFLHAKLAQVQIKPIVHPVWMLMLRVSLKVSVPV